MTRILGREGWTTRTLAECGQLLSGGTPNKGSDAYWNGSIPWISAKSLKTFHLSDSEDRLTEAGVRHGSRLVPSGTVLFVVRGMSLANEFRIGVTTRAVAFNQDVRALLPRDDVIPGYLAHFLRAAETRILGLVDRASHGTARLTSDRIEEFPVPLPPLVEQQRIAGILDRAEALRAKRRAALAQVDGLTQSIFIEMFGDPVGNPLRWPATRLVDVLSEPLRNGVSPSKSGRVMAKVLTLSAVTGDEFNPTALKVSTFERQPQGDQAVDDADLLICRGNGNIELVGRGFFPRAAMRDVTFPDTIIAARIDAQRIDRRYLEHVWNSRAVRPQIESNARTTNGTFKVNQAVLERIAFVAPPLDLQRAFASRAAAVDKLKAAHRASLAQLDALFASLQHRAFRGEL